MITSALYLFVYLQNPSFLVLECFSKLNIWSPIYISEHLTVSSCVCHSGGECGPADATQIDLHRQKAVIRQPRERTCQPPDCSVCNLLELLYTETLQGKNLFCQRAGFSLTLV